MKADKKFVQKYAREFDALITRMKELFFSDKNINLYHLDITIPQSNVMNLLLEKDYTMTELSARLRLALNTVSESINRLVRDKLVTRARDGKDRRIVRVKLTQKGRNTIHTFKKLHLQRLLMLFKNLSKAEIKRAVRNFKDNLILFEKAIQEQKKSHKKQRSPAGIVGATGRLPVHKALVLAGSLMFGSSAGVRAETVYDLEASIQFAVKNNSSLKQIDQKVLEAQAKYSESKASVLPKISLNTSLTKLQEARTSSFGGVKILFSSDVQVFSRLSLSTPLYSSGKLELGKRIIFQALSLQRYEQQRVLIETIYQVKDIYFRVLQSKHLLSVAESGVKSAQKHLEVTENLKAQGVLSKYDVLRSKVAVTSAQQKLIQVQNMFSTNKAAFLYIIGANLLETYELKDVDTDVDIKALVPEFTPEEAAYYALEHRPEVLMTTMQKDMGKNTLKVEKLGGFPDIYFSGYYDFTRGDRIPIQWNKVYSLELMMNMTLYDSGVKRFKIKQAGAVLKASDEALSDIKRKAALEVGNGFLAMKEALARYENSRSKMDEAEESVKLAEERYENGVGLLVDVLDAQSALESAQAELYTSLYDFYRALAQIDKSMGKPVEF